MADRKLVANTIRIIRTTQSPQNQIDLRSFETFLFLVKTEIPDLQFDLRALTSNRTVDNASSVLLSHFRKWEADGNNWIKQWKKCVNLVNYAVKHRELHLKFRDLLAKCYRDANMRGCGVAGSSSSSSSSSKKRRRSTSAALQNLHRKMASLVRDKLIEHAIADVQAVAESVQQLKAQGDAVGATQKENLRLQLMQQRDQLQQTNLGWRMAWGVVDLALAGMDFFRGDDEAVMFRCFHDVQDLFLADCDATTASARKDILRLQPGQFRWEEGRVGIGMRKLMQSKKSVESGGQRKDVDCYTTIRKAATAAHSEPPKTYQILSKLHNAIYGHVCMGTLLLENQMFPGVYKCVPAPEGKVAIKCLDLAKVIKRPQQEDPLNELAALRLVTSSRPKYVPFFREVAHDAKHIFKIETAAGIELFEVCTTHFRQILTPQNVQILFKKLIFAVEHLHAYGIVHLDISLENILVNPKTLDLSLIDMGLCRRIPRDLATGRALDFPARSMNPTGKLVYIDPLIFNHCAFNGELADVYSCGACLFILHALSPPYAQPVASDPNFLALCANGAGGVIQSWVKAGYIRNNVPTSCIDLLNRTYAPDMKDRLTIDQIIQHPYLNQALPERRLRRAGRPHSQLHSVLRTKFVRQQELVRRLINRAPSVSASASACTCELAPPPGFAPAPGPAPAPPSPAAGLASAPAPAPAPPSPPVPPPGFAPAPGPAAAPGPGSVSGPAPAPGLVSAPAPAPAPGVAPTPAPLSPPVSPPGFAPAPGPAAAPGPGSVSGPAPAPAPGPVSGPAPVLVPGPAPTPAGAPSASSHHLTDNDQNSTDMMVEESNDLSPTVLAAAKAPALAGTMDVEDNTVPRPPQITLDAEFPLE